VSDEELKQQVRTFYDQVGWKLESDGFYQNARYEDLRPVSQEYIEKCHLRINRHLIRPGKYLLDAGSGPIQYPAYLTYMDGYQYRVCVDISIVALKEARTRIADRGLFVVADVANLPFKSDVFDGIVTLHTLHHLKIAEQRKAYRSLCRVLATGRNLVLVNGWTESSLMKNWFWLVKWMEYLTGLINKIAGKKADQVQKQPSKPDDKNNALPKSTGTFIEKLTADWLRRELADLNFHIFVWRSVSVRFLRAVIHPKLAGKFWLRLLYKLEEKNPEYYGVNGQYPLIVIKK